MHWIMLTPEEEAVLNRKSIQAKIQKIRRLRVYAEKQYMDLEGRTRSTISHAHTQIALDRWKLIAEVCTLAEQHLRSE
ncbi:MAG: hypothetical protein ACI4JQ_06460 [Ruminococcus sp.]